ncbi:hypothetical protein COB21_02470 [Candidatus Aerophobetes bacterium]|uniref:Phosphagen kinase C-terminal domain-containing protein n=1 Tax=Aerophobetes bacterium TaxID=2030807 RepID=A0A2A4X715_UNCAE|nr:MAG: hypothetical protein COB21_02470 [Candidatus Aerophobetes bacterium]
MSNSIFDLSASNHPIRTKSLSNIWIMSNLYLRRNLSLFPFTGKMEESDFQELELILKKTLPSISPHIFHNFLKTSEISSIHAQALLEYYFSLSSLKKPGKESFYFESQNRQTITHINNEDHITVQQLQKNPFKPYEIKSLCDLSMKIAEKIPLALSEKYGYLTPSTNYCGTGLVIEVYLHLPFLLKSSSYEQIRESMGRIIDMVGLNGANGFVGDFAIIKNKICLGVDEETLLKKVQDKALKLVEQEQKMRRNEALHHHWYHEVAKAFGALKHGTLFSVVEAFNLLSLLKVGIDLSWVQRIEDSEVNELLLKLRRGHIQNEHNRVLDQDELGLERARLIKEKIQSVVLEKL